MIYENCKIYGPYFRKDGRQHICVIRPNGKRSTVSYPKYLMEIKLDRYLGLDETIDHKDKNPLNNDFDNLQILSRSEHTKKDVRKLEPKDFICKCGTKFTLAGIKLSRLLAQQKRNRSLTGPFCSKSCLNTAQRLILNKIRPAKCPNGGIGDTQLS